MNVDLQIYENKGFDPEVILTSYQSFDPEVDTEVWFTQRPKSSFQLIWENVSRTVKIKEGVFSSKYHKRTILEPMNGLIEGGTITALMGPSGAGKTTLLKIIGNKISCSSTTGTKGQVYIRHNLSRQDAKSFRIGYVPQDDELFREFTVKETFMFASKMTNGHLKTKSHQVAVKEIMTKLDLLEKANSAIKKLSGGQIKRTSIGVELMSYPQILILDEPTSGLDSDTSEKVITLLRNLVQKPLHLNDAPAVLCTIHQPSRDVFFLFDNIFLLSRAGQNIYHGRPQGVIQYLNSFGYHSKNTNPAEYMIEFANGKHGNVAFKEMSSHTYQTTFSQICQNKQQSCRSRRFSSVFNELPVSELRMKTMTSFLAQVLLLFRRSFQKYTLKSWWTWYKIACGIIVAALLFDMSKKPFGEILGCWDTYQVFTTPEKEDNKVPKVAEKIASITKSDRFNFNLLGMFTSIKEGTSFAYLTLQYQMMFYALNMVFTFPLELKTHLKEMSNSWYSVFAFFVAKSFHNAVHLLICTIPFYVYIYWVSHQPLDFWVRPVTAFAVIYTYGMIWETKAEIICLIFAKVPQTISVVVITMMFFPTLFLAGFNVRYVDMWWLLQPISRANDLTHAFEANMITGFGFDRCRNSTIATNPGVFAQTINVKKILETLWATLGGGKSDTETWAFLLGQPADYLYPIYDGFTDFFKAPTQTDNNLHRRKSDSFMLDFYEIDEKAIFYNFGNLLSTLIMCKFLSFILIKLRASVKH
jgi:ABC-type multidrug transport system ATPase subunit